uniref:Site-specific recombination directionality factor RDF n=1 Tax=Pakpunavirus sp. TaxID=2833053 RepID=A0AB39C0Q9_9CAUD
MKKLIQTLAVALAMAAIAGCDTDASVASRNLSKAADMFEIERRIVFYDAIGGLYLLSIEGRCSIRKDGADNQLEVTCKTGPSEYKKHFLGISDNVTYFAEQLGQANVSVYNYRVIFKPEALIPNIDIETSLTN